MPDIPSAIGDIAISVLPLNEFRKKHNDTGPAFIWFPCDNSNLAGTPLGAVLQRTPDFTSRYPRGFGPVPELAAGETGNVGTTISQRLLRHNHTVTMDIESFDHGDTETGPVHNPRPNHHTWTTSDAGDSSENRPNSVIVFFYIRVR